ncbi:MAG TPA: hypothetical protein VF637_13960 [Sphingomicrobium sp.]|jgi:hypothetical protein
MKDEEFEDASQAHFRRSSHVTTDKMMQAAAPCFPAANAVAKAMDQGKVDRSLPEALRALGLAIEELTLIQRVLGQRLRLLTNETDMQPDV